jgi:hypothetical protein
MTKINKKIIRHLAAKVPNQPSPTLNFTSPFFITRLRATPPVLSMWPCTVKLDEEKWIYVGLSQENGFSPGKEESNKFDLTTIPYFLIGKS